ncbi:hypothetical protein [Nocardia fluminea]|uniref:hypothetical protein n=1 Tax=Nocardia fluminea TaxID=134984 RepID=UPI001FE93D10|nr:hypothetical protein [Nocardia fluminea]
MTATTISPPISPPQRGRDVLADRLRLGGYTLPVNNADTAGHVDFAGLPLESELTTLDLNCRSIVVLAHAFSAGPHPVVLCHNRYRENGYRLPCH